MISIIWIIWIIWIQYFEYLIILYFFKKINVLFWRNNDALGFFKDKKVLGLQRKQAGLPHNFFRKNKLFFSTRSLSNNTRPMLFFLQYNFQVGKILFFQRVLYSAPIAMQAINFFFGFITIFILNYRISSIDYDILSCYIFWQRRR